MDVIFVGRQFQKNPGQVWAMAEELGVEIYVAHQIEWALQILYCEVYRKLELFCEQVVCTAMFWKKRHKMRLGLCQFFFFHPLSKPIILIALKKKLFDSESSHRSFLSSKNRRCTGNSRERHGVQFFKR